MADVEVGESTAAGIGTGSVDGDGAAGAEDRGLRGGPVGGHDVDRVDSVEAARGVTVTAVRAQVEVLGFGLRRHAGGIGALVAVDGVLELGRQGVAGMRVQRTVLRRLAGGVGEREARGVAEDAGVDAGFGEGHGFGIAGRRVDDEHVDGLGHRDVGVLVAIGHGHVEAVARHVAGDADAGGIGEGESAGGDARRVDRHGIVVADDVTAAIDRDPVVNAGRPGQHGGLV